MAAMHGLLSTQIIHDYEHKGVNNDYLIRVSDGLAVLYNGGFAVQRQLVVMPHLSSQESPMG